MLTRLHLAGALALVLVIAWPALALAETVDVTPAVVSILDAVQAVASIAVVGVLTFVAGFLPPFIRELVVSFARARAKAATDAIITRVRMRYFAGPWSVEIQNELVAELVRQLASRVPDALRRLGGTPQELQDLVAGWLGEYIDRLPSEERPKGYVGIQGLT